VRRRRRRRKFDFCFFVLICRLAPSSFFSSSPSSLSDVHFSKTRSQFLVYPPMSILASLHTLNEEQKENSKI